MQPHVHASPPARTSRLRHQGPACRRARCAGAQAQGRGAPWARVPGSPGCRRPPGSAASARRSSSGWSHRCRSRSAPAARCRPRSTAASRCSPARARAPRWLGRRRHAGDRPPAATHSRAGRIASRPMLCASDVLACGPMAAGWPTSRRRRPGRLRRRGRHCRRRPRQPPGPARARSARTRKKVRRATGAGRSAPGASWSRVQTPT